MIHVSYPEPSFRTKIEGGKRYLFDALRKLWVVLTEEEWVRQNFVQYVTRELKYPAALIAIEKEITVGELKKRFDILVYNDHHQPWMMIECKAPSIALDDTVLQQVLRYHIAVPVLFLVITNGDHTYAWEKKNNELVLLEQLPAWDAVS